MLEIGKLSLFIHRAFIYWRMLSSDPEKAKHTVLCDKPELEEEGFRYD